jgi:hypothetical protein
MKMLHRCGQSIFVTVVLCISLISCETIQAGRWIDENALLVGCQTGTQVKMDVQLYSWNGSPIQAEIAISNIVGILNMHSNADDHAILNNGFSSGIVVLQAGFGVQNLASLNASLTPNLQGKLMAKMPCPGTAEPKDLEFQFNAVRQTK